MIRQGARYIPRASWIAAVLLSAFAVALHLHWLSFNHALWRDEVNSVNLVSLPAFGTMWSNLDYDSFPLVFFILLRGWVKLFGVADDLPFRVLGCLIGLGTLASVWFCSLRITKQPPLLSIALVGLNLIVIRYGDSVRAFGLGICLILVTAQCFCHFASEASEKPKTLTSLALLALLSVHTLYYNSVLLLAVACGAMVVALRKRAWRKIVVILAIGSLSAVSLLIYLPMILRMRSWTPLLYYPCSWRWLWHRSCEVTGTLDSLGILIWLIGVAFTLIVVSYLAFRRSGHLSDVTIFSTVSLLVGIVGYGTFLKVLHRYTEPWYYITLAAFVGCMLDCIFATAAGNKGGLRVTLQIARIVIAIFYFGLVASPLWDRMRLRYTNVDVVSAELSKLATENDIVLVSQWTCGIPLSRYYHGAAPIMTLPPLREHLLHRYDLIREALLSPGALESAKIQLEQKLKAGGRVFVVAELSLPTAIRNPSHGNYPAFLVEHAGTNTLLSVESGNPNPVDSYENVQLAVLQGWR